MLVSVDYSIGQKWFSMQTLSHKYIRFGDWHNIIIYGDYWHPLNNLPSNLKGLDVSGLDSNVPFPKIAFIPLGLKKLIIRKDQKKYIENVLPDGCELCIYDEDGDEPFPTLLANF